MSEQKSHSFLNNSRSFIDYFDDLGETEGADTPRLNKGFTQMIKLYKADTQIQRVINGTARFDDINIFEKKNMQLTKAAAEIKDGSKKIKRKVLAERVFKEKNKRGGKEAYDRKRKNKLQKVL